VVRIIFPLARRTSRQLFLPFFLSFHPPPSTVPPKDALRVAIALALSPLCPARERPPAFEFFFDGHDWLGDVP